MFGKLQVIWYCLSKKTNNDVKEYEGDMYHVKELEIVLWIMRKHRNGIGRLCFK